MSEEKKIKAGDLYKVITVAGREFEIYYMDCGVIDPESKGELIPDFPFFDDPEYTDDRYPYTNQLNEACEHYKANSDRPDLCCYDCIYFQDAVEEIGVCRCTARRRREEPTEGGKLIRVAVIGKLPTAERIVREAYANVQIDRYDRATDISYAPAEYHLILTESYAGEGLGLIGLTATYKTDTGEKVTTPVRLLAEPPCISAECELATLVNWTIAKKVNGEADA